MVGGGWWWLVGEGWWWLVGGMMMWAIRLGNWQIEILFDSSFISECNICYLFNYVLIHHIVALFSSHAHWAGDIKIQGMNEISYLKLLFYCYNLVFYAYMFPHNLSYFFMVYPKLRIPSVVHSDNSASSASLCVQTM